MATDCVNLIDKHDARGFFLGFLKHIAHTRCAHTDKHLDKIRTRNAKKFYRQAQKRKQESLSPGFKYFKVQMKISLKELPSWNLNVFSKQKIDFAFRIGVFYPFAYLIFRNQIFPSRHHVIGRVSL